MTTSRETRRESWQKTQPTLPAKQQAILDLLRHVGRASTRQLSRMRGEAPSDITSTIDALRKADLVVEAGRTWDDETRRNVTTWRAATLAEQITAEREREQIEAGRGVQGRFL